MNYFYSKVKITNNRKFIDSIRLNSKQPHGIENCTALKHRKICRIMNKTWSKHNVIEHALLFIYLKQNKRFTPYTPISTKLITDIPNHKPIWALISLTNIEICKICLIINWEEQFYSLRNILLVRNTRHMINRHKKHSRSHSFSLKYFHYSLIAKIIKNLA